MFVKICGIREKREIDWAVSLGYNAIGIVVYPLSKRFVPTNRAIELINYAKGKILTVVVSLNYRDVKDFENISDFVQIYEYVNLKGLIYATDSPPKYQNFSYLLYDSSKGSGKFKEIPEWVIDFRDRLIVAGGLNSKNVKDVIDYIQPFGVDVSSSVEKDGKKDFKLMKEFMEYGVRRNRDV